MFTPEQIKLTRLTPDCAINRTRTPENRIVFEWECPGGHTYDRRVVAYGSEQPTEAEICADPYCWYCRRERTHG